MSRPRKYWGRTAMDKANRARAKAWYDANRDKALEQKAAWRRENPDKVRGYLENNRDRIRDYQRDYYLKVTKAKRAAKRQA